MRSHPGKILAISVVLLGAIVSAGCTETRVGDSSLWPFRRNTADRVPGVPSPAERIATLRKMRQKAAWAKPDEQARISGELATAFQGESDPLIRIEILRAIAAYPPSETSTEVLQASLEDPDPDVRVAACLAWGKRGGPEAVAKLSDVLADDANTDVRLTAAKALGETGDRQAVTALGKVLEERNPAMQYQAVASLREVTGDDLGGDVEQWRQYVKGEPPTPSEPISIAERVRRVF
jgi:HEAT repeat protein